MNYITILDFESGRVYQYHISKATPFLKGETTYEDYLIDKGHNLSKIECRVHSNNEQLKE